jgi:hypothetical protein
VTACMLNSSCRKAVEKGGRAVAEEVVEKATEAYEYICLMSKGGNQNKKNEYAREAERNSPNDPCKYLEQLRLSLNRRENSEEIKKIEKAEKSKGCRNKRKR